MTHSSTNRPEGRRQEKHRPVGALYRHHKRTRLGSVAMPRYRLFFDNFEQRMFALFCTYRV